MFIRLVIHFRDDGRPVEQERIVIREEKAPLPFVPVIENGRKVYVLGQSTEAPLVPVIPFRGRNDTPRRF